MNLESIRKLLIMLKQQPWSMQLHRESLNKRHRRRQMRANDATAQGQYQMEMMMQTQRLVIRGSRVKIEIISARWSKSCVETWVHPLLEGAKMQLQKQEVHRQNRTRQVRPRRNPLGQLVAPSEFPWGLRRWSTWPKPKMLWRKTRLQSKYGKFSSKKRKAGPI